MKFLSFAALRGEPLRGEPLARRRARFGARPAAARPARNRREQKNPPGPRAVSRRRGALNRSEDGLGSVVATNDPAGAVSHSVVFDAWGNTKSEVGVRQHPFTYTGREVGEAGLLSYRARFYQPGIGRFTSEDPLRYSASRNHFLYVSASPTDRVDPHGLICGIKVWREPVTYNWFGSGKWKDAFKNTWGHEWIEWPGGNMGFWPRDRRPNSPFETVPGVVKLNSDPNAKKHDSSFTSEDAISVDGCSDCKVKTDCLENYGKSFTAGYCLTRDHCRTFVVGALRSCGLSTVGLEITNPDPRRYRENPALLPRGL